MRNRILQGIRMNRPQARAKLSEFLVGSIEQARAVEKPFYHLQFDRVFPQDIYDAMIRQMPVDRDYRALPGRNNVNILDDGSATRIKIDLFPEYIRNMPAQKRELWDVVGRALCSNEVRDAFVRRLAPALERRFGPDYRDVGMFPIPILTRDVPKYKITPHTDTKWSPPAPARLRRHPQPGRGGDAAAGAGGHVGGGDGRPGAPAPGGRRHPGAAQGWPPAGRRRGGRRARRPRRGAAAGRAPHRHHQHPRHRLQPVLGPGGPAPAAPGLGGDRAGRRRPG